MNLDLIIRRFWQKRSVLNYLLVPLSWVYLIGHFLKFYVFNKPRKVDALVICVGNAIAGGSGKTPFCIALAQKLKDRGLSVAFVSKGYGRVGIAKGEVIKVQPGDDYRRVGDESLLLAAVVPTYVSNSRVAACQAAVMDGAEMIILDDGLQDNSIHKDFTYLVVNDKYQFGNGLYLPAGPMREPLSWALKKVDEVCCAQHLKGNDELIISEEYNVLGKVTGKKIIAFCGIANPNQFFDQLKLMDFEVVAEHAFSDHHSYTEREMIDVMDQAQALGAQVITTSKDAVKLPAEMQGHILILQKESAFDLSDSKITKLLSKS